MESSSKENETILWDNTITVSLKKCAGQIVNGFTLPFKKFPNTQLAGMAKNVFVHFKAK